MQLETSDPQSDVNDYSIKKPRGKGKTLGYLVLMLITLGAGVLLGRSTVTNNPIVAPVQSSELDLSLFNKVKNIIQSEHVNAPVDVTDLEFGAIKGLVAGIGDPNSNFMDPDETKAFQENLAGIFQGIGIEIALRDDVLTVVAPLAGTPAEAAGLQAGDSILAIDQTDTSKLSLDEAVLMIRGEKGTQVALTIKREGEFESQEFKITRDEINVDSARYEVRDDGIGVLSIFRFGEDTSSIVRKAADEFLARNVSGIVLDLRGNPGGFLETGVDVAGYFVKEGVIVTEEFGDGTKQEYRAESKGRLAGIPLVILIDEGSASASEIVAGALQDYKKATLVGKKSFGKGSVQELQSLDKNTSLRLTVALFVLPNGRKIDKKGIEPDVEVDISREDIQNQFDPQLEKALEILKTE